MYYSSTGSSTTDSDTRAFKREQPGLQICVVGCCYEDGFRIYTQRSQIIYSANTVNTPGPKCSRIQNRNLVIMTASQARNAATPEASRNYNLQIVTTAEPSA